MPVKYKTNRKLSDAAVADIKATPRVWGSNKLLATKYGVTSALISMVRSGKRGSYSTDPKYRRK